MEVTARLKTALPVVVFVMAAALTYLGVTHWRPKAELQTTDDTIAGIDGLRKGDVVALPQMRTLKGERAALENAAEDKFLFAFFTPSCEGCSLDAALWKRLNEESAKKGVAFYIVDVGNDRAGLDKFIQAYGLASLPILVSEGRSVGPIFKVNIVPQYLLIAKGGKVLHRWDGVQHNKPPLWAYENRD
jgi:peroxiredoxin